MPSSTRRRELERLRARRDAERRKAQARRRLILVATALVILVIGAAGVFAILHNTKKPAAKATAASKPTVPTVAPNDARADAPTAPAAVACGAKVPPRHQHKKYSAVPKLKLVPGDTYKVTVDTSCGTFQIQVNQKAAPITAANFIFLANEGFYDSTWFHRVLRGTDGGSGVIQGGDPTGAGDGGPGYTIKDELPTAPDPYKTFTVAMANRGPNTAGSQFFTNTKDNSASLQPDYAVFGTVVGGLDVVKRIGVTPTGGETGETPTLAVWINSATVEHS